MPDRVPADNAGELLALSFGGARPDGSRYVTGELVASGAGASRDKDGVDVIETDATNCMNLPAEALELDAPIRVNRAMLRRDSGGAGAHRGGLGILREYEILHGEVRFTHRGERHFIAPKGSAGGRDGAMARTVIYRSGGGEEVIPSKLVTTLHAGDRVVFETAGRRRIRRPGSAHRRAAACRSRGRQDQPRGRRILRRDTLIRSDLRS